MVESCGNLFFKTVAMGGCEPRHLMPKHDPRIVLGKLPKWPNLRMLYIDPEVKSVTTPLVFIRSHCQSLLRWTNSPALAKRGLKRSFDIFRPGISRVLMDLMTYDSWCGLFSILISLLPVQNIRVQLVHVAETCWVLLTAWTQLEPPCMHLSISAAK